jgi:ABC-type dipeptide/oligopeptide/nickel transport system permease component
VFAFISRRIGVLLVILFGSSFILYNLAAISGDPLEGLRTSSEPNAKQQIVNLTRTLQLDVPPPLRYSLYDDGYLDSSKVESDAPISIVVTQSGSGVHFVLLRIAAEEAASPQANLLYVCA